MQPTLRLAFWLSKNPYLVSNLLFHKASAAKGREGGKYPHSVYNLEDK